MESEIVLPSTPRIPPPSAPMLRRGALLFPVLVFFAGASLIREASIGLLKSSEEYWAGRLIKRTRPVTGAAVTLVEISDETTGKHVWPWAAADFAVFFHAALPFNPASIAVEPVLDADRGALAGEAREEIYDKMLHDGVLRAPKLVLGGALGYAPDAESAPAMQAMPVLPKVRGDLSRVPEFTAVESWAEERFRLSTKPGWTNLPETLGPLGRCPLLFRYRGQPVPSITLQLAMYWEKVTADEVEIELGSHLLLGKKRVPIDDAGRMVVNFGVNYDRVTYDDLLLIREQLDKGEAPSRPVEMFKDRVLLLGRTDGFVRTIALSTGAKITPAELFTSAVATIQSNAHPRRIGAWFDWFLIFVVAGAALGIPKTRTAWLVAAVVVSEVLFVLGAIFVYGSRGIILPGILPLGLAIWMIILRLVARKAQKVIAF